MTHRYTIAEPERVPWLSLFLGYGAMVPIAAGALAAWLSSGDARALVLHLTLVWSGAVLVFLAGVRRGLAFRSPAPETLPQLLTMLWLFALGFAGFALMPRVVATPLLLLGFVSVGVFDALAARKEEAPPYFARLRPLQMAIPVASLLVLLWRQAG